MTGAELDIYNGGQLSYNEINDAVATYLDLKHSRKIKINKN